VDVVPDGGDGDADHLLDRILRNALGGGQDSIKKEGGVKNEAGVKSENLKKEVKNEANIKGEVKGELVVKNEIAVKRELADVPALPPFSTAMDTQHHFARSGPDTPFTRRWCKLGRSSSCARALA